MKKVTVRLFILEFILFYLLNCFLILLKNPFHRWQLLAVDGHLYLAEGFGSGLNLGAVSKQRSEKIGLPPH
jgi:hypothetical protein